MGGLFASFFLDAGLPVTLLLRDAPTRSRQATLTVRRGEQRHRYTVAVEGTDNRGRIDHLLVTTKAGDVEHALESVAARLSRHAVVVVLGNGMGHQQRLQARWPEWRFAWGTTTEGAWREGPLQLRHAGSGETLLGAAGEARPGWFADWQHLGIRCRWDRNIQQALWRKLAINCAINPLTALHDCPNGQLLEPPLDAEVAALCAEISAVAGAAGQSAAVADLPAQVTAVLQGTAANRSSMLQDVRAGRATEIDFLTAYLVGLARHYGIATPHNSRLLEAVRALRAPAASHRER